METIKIQECVECDFDYSLDAGDLITNIYKCTKCGKIKAEVIFSDDGDW